MNFGQVLSGLLNECQTFCHCLKLPVLLQPSNCPVDNQLGR